LPELAHPDFLKKQRTFITDSTKVHVVEEHHHAMSWWLRALHSDSVQMRGPAAKPTTTLLKSKMDEIESDGSLFSKRRLLVHVDSHADICSSYWGGLDTTETGNRTSLAKKMNGDKGIGSFIAAGAMAGVVSDVVWIRSSFRGCEYNGPGPGHYQIGLFVAQDGKGVCQRILESMKHKDQVMRDKFLGIKAPHFDTCPQVSYTSDGMQMADDPIATFNLTVTTEDFFNNHGLDELELDGVDEWFLDIDEDFFASYHPGWHYLETFLSGIPEDTLKQIRVALRHLGTSCTESAMPFHGIEHWGDTATAKLWKVLAAVPRCKGDESCVELLKWPEEFKECNTPQSMKKTLATLTAGFTDQHAKLWKEGFRAMGESDAFVDVGERVDVFYEGCHMPEHVPTSAELASSIEAVKKELQNYVSRFGKPRVLTLARSVLNYFLPKSQWPAIESSVHLLLEEVLGAEVQLVEDEENPPMKLYSHRL